MASFDLKRTLSNQNNRGVITGMLGVATKYKTIPYTKLILDYKKYEIDEQEVIDLAYSIASVGLEQNLVVKETEVPNQYVLVTGHKRISAIFYIFEQNMEISATIRKNIEEPMCIVISKDEDPLITRFRMHETNVYKRTRFTISEIEDYINIVKEAKSRRLEVNGKQIKGITRVILHKKFGLSETTAKKCIKIIKKGNEELKKAIDDGKISINNAYDILMGNAEPVELNAPPKMGQLERYGTHRGAYRENRKKIFDTQTVCGICGKPVDFSLKYPHPLSRCCDHIMPLAWGGHPSDIDNLQLAHLSCNRRKSANLVRKA